MSRIEPLPESDATDKVEQTYGRIREMLGVEEVPEPFLLMGRSEAFLSDFYMNFKKFIIKDGKLDPQTKIVIGLAVALKEDSTPIVELLQAIGVQRGLSHEALADIIALVGTNAMYNSFFKFRKIAGTDIFEGMPVALRAHTFQSTQFDDKTVELVSIAISNQNVCAPCVSGHVAKARKLEIPDEAILEAIQITGTIAAGVQFLKSCG
ncbi:carboxymuconolactone decarboxylase family protein [Calycomorphotria hydatis]|uniref:Alkyl hydroperoxide reductase AhpD n=1 Tax=Calycomorphotria hydatis TaxID=2528027 RepID=A0A517TE93_9PLAN|nr:carboxymuconolactone decarboxylase family protein [Calycomorphotria hydatis]QDT66694.1 Alkyl hydroperoxide reductase AhpD [Calycomorphotria hydatis]